MPTTTDSSPIRARTLADMLMLISATC